MKNLLNFQECLAIKHKYSKLDSELSKRVRKIYKDNIPPFLDIYGGKINLFTKEGTLLCESYNRIVIGDYGAFIEIEPLEINTSMIKIKEGQEYRTNDPKYLYSVKYEWFTMKDESDIKIYWQKRKVSYADYKPGLIYVSVYEVI